MKTLSLQLSLEHRKSEIHLARNRSNMLPNKSLPSEKYTQKSESP